MAPWSIALEEIASTAIFPLEKTPRSCETSEDSDGGSKPAAMAAADTRATSALRAPGSPSCS